MARFPSAMRVPFVSPPLTYWPPVLYVRKTSSIMREINWWGVVTERTKPVSSSLSRTFTRTHPPNLEPTELPSSRHLPFWSSHLPNKAFHSARSAKVEHLHMPWMCMRSSRDSKFWPLTVSWKLQVQEVLMMSEYKLKLKSLNYHFFCWIPLLTCW